MSRGGGTQGLKGKKIPGDTPDRAKRFYPLVGSTEEIAPAKALMGMVWSVMCPGPVEQPLTAKDHIFDSFYGLDVNGTTGVHNSEISCIYNQLLSGRQIVFHTIAVDLQKDGSAARKFLHNKAFAAEKAGP